MLEISLDLPTWLRLPHDRAVVDVAEPVLAIAGLATGSSVDHHHDADKEDVQEHGPAWVAGSAPPAVPPAAAGVAFDDDALAAAGGAGSGAGSMFKRKRPVSASSRHAGARGVAEDTDTEESTSASAAATGGAADRSTGGTGGTGRSHMALASNDEEEDEEGEGPGQQLQPDARLQTVGGITLQRSGRIAKRAAAAAAAAGGGAAAAGTPPLGALAAPPSSLASTRRAFAALAAGAPSSASGGSGASSSQLFASPGGRDGGFGQGAFPMLPPPGAHAARPRGAAAAAQAAQAREAAAAAAAHGPSAAKRRRAGGADGAELEEASLTQATDEEGGGAVGRQPGERHGQPFQQLSEGEEAAAETAGRLGARGRGRGARGGRGRGFGARGGRAAHAHAGMAGGASLLGGNGNGNGGALPPAPPVTAVGLGNTGSVSWQGGQGPMLTYQHQQMRMQQQAAWQQQQQMQLQAAAAGAAGRYGGAIGSSGLPTTTLGPPTTALPRRITSTGSLGLGFGPAGFGAGTGAAGLGSSWPSANIAATGGGSGLIYPPASGPGIIAGIYGRSNGSLSSVGSVGSEEGGLAGLPFTGGSAVAGGYYGGQLGSGLQPLAGGLIPASGSATESAGITPSNTTALISRQPEAPGGISTAMVQTAVPPTGALLPFLRTPITVQGGAVQAGNAMHAEGRAHSVGLDGKPLDAAVAVDDAAASTPGGGQGQRHRVAAITQRDVGGQPLLVALGIDSNTQQASGASTGGGPAGAQLTHIEAHSVSSAPSGVPVSVDVAFDVKATMGNATALPGSAAHQQMAMMSRGMALPAGQWQTQAPQQLAHFGGQQQVQQLSSSVSQQQDPAARVASQSAPATAGAASAGSDDFVSQLPSWQQPVTRSPFEGLAGNGPGLGPISRGQGLFGSSPELFSSEMPGSVAAEGISGSGGRSDSQLSGGGTAGGGVGLASEVQAQALSPAGSLGLNLFETPPTSTNVASKRASEQPARTHLPQAADAGLGDIALRGPGEWDQSAGGVAAYTGEADEAHVAQEDAPRSIVMAGSDLAEAMLQDEQAEAEAAQQAQAGEKAGGSQPQLESSQLHGSSTATKQPQVPSNFSGQPEQPQQEPFAGW